VNGSNVHLVADEVSKAYGGDPVLVGLSLEVRRGECLALMGPSGCGKSTLLHCLAGLLRPDRGHIVCGGTELTALGERQVTAFRLQHFGFVFQFSTLLADLTIAENVALPLLLRGVKRRLSLETAEQWLRSLGIGHTAARLPSSLSGGEQQRAAVARAMIAEPAVVFADEPTGALDGDNADRVLDLLLRAARERSTTVVLVTHDQLTAKSCDRTLALRGGRLHAEDAS